MKWAFVAVACASIGCAGLHGQDATAQGPSVEVLNKASAYKWDDYLAVVFAKIREKWYQRIPKSAHPPESKSGVVKIEFAVVKNGRVVDAKIFVSSGDSSLDEAALEAILKSSRLPKLPKDSGQERLKLRFTFTYNPREESAE